MGLIICLDRLAFFLFVSHFCLVFGTGTDTITRTQLIKDPNSIVSNGSVFRLGFFSPNGSTDRYAGIWFDNASVINVVWVANRERPLNDSSGVLKISEKGNLILLNGQNDILWSSNASNSTTNSIAQLLNSGNLVLKEANSSNGEFMWESFRHPGDSMLPNMKISTNLRTGESITLTSWRSPSDPSYGSFFAFLDPLNIPEIYIWNNSVPYWRSGPWNNQVFIGVPSMNSVYLDGFNLVKDTDGTTYLTTDFADETFLTFFVLRSDGKLLQLTQEDAKKDWETSWISQETECDVYGKCGVFGSCDAENQPICTCLKGFKPRNMEEWSRGNWTSGCIRRKQLQCERNISGGGEEGKDDKFLKLRMMKVPANAEWSSNSEGNCRSQCTGNCSCIAYAYDSGIGCMTWGGNLTDVQKFSYAGSDLFIRLAYSELDENRDMTPIIIIGVIMGTFVIICSFFIWRCMAKQRVKRAQHKEVGEDAYLNFIGGDIFGDEIEHTKLQELPLFTFETLASATTNFHAENKLGQGGFGPVYKGTLPSGKVIAVKRLSRASGQGLEEFMNEVEVISKLQHRNLVRLLGCCTEKEEKILIYEYLPNKSLDAYLFDPLKQKLLPWGKRFEIIGGIGRGLLYLHRDSILRIIHRDLKASNILLDTELHPKISDFGMARIFDSNQDQANTARVVGTYGYMSPEYAMEGRFSEKSDVFSFGVLLLEIVSGRRNTSFYHDEHSRSLLGYAWKIWKEGEIEALIDPAIFDASFSEEMIRCIHIGLLCVQEYANDRPSVSTILSMLSSEIVDLPTPQQPAFSERENNIENIKSSQKRLSANKVTITVLEGR